MELKWLEDFVSLARTRSFSRSAEERHITQSAFSRRIQALEAWLGAALIDRSSYPTTLTPEGRQFHESASEVIRLLYASRLDAQGSTKPSQQTISIAALHTLSLRFFPRWLRRIEESIGLFNSRLLPDDFHNCLRALAEGSYDFLLTFNHPSVPVTLDPKLFPSIVVGSDSLIAVVRRGSTAADLSTSPSLPLLSYARDSFLGRVASFAQAQAGSPRTQIIHTNENAMADALKFMVLEGHGLAWLPRSLVESELADGSLNTFGPQISMEIRLYRDLKRSRPSMELFWSTAKKIAEEKNKASDEIG